MRAVVIRDHGGPEVLEVADVPVPEPGPGQVRIRVEAATVNPVDLATRIRCADRGRAGPAQGRDRYRLGRSRIG